MCVLCLTDVCEGGGGFGGREEGGSFLIYLIYLSMHPYPGIVTPASLGKMTLAHFNDVIRRAYRYIRGAHELLGFLLSLQP